MTTLDYVIVIRKESWLFHEAIIIYLERRRDSSIAVLFRRWCPFCRWCPSLETMNHESLWVTQLIHRHNNSIEREPLSSTHYRLIIDVIRVIISRFSHVFLLCYFGHSLVVLLTLYSRVIILLHYLAGQSQVCKEEASTTKMKTIKISSKERVLVKFFFFFDRQQSVTQVKPKRTSEETSWQKSVISNKFDQTVKMCVWFTSSRYILLCDSFILGYRRKQ